MHLCFAIVLCISFSCLGAAAMESELALDHIREALSLKGAWEFCPSMPMQRFGNGMRMRGLNSGRRLPFAQRVIWVRACETSPAGR